MASVNNNLLIWGAGHLGTRVARDWKALFPEAKVKLVTGTANSERTEKWTKLGYLTDHDGSESLERDAEKYGKIVFCVAPVGAAVENYVALAEKALKFLDSSSAGSSFVFTSSGGVYSENSGGLVDENSGVTATDRTVLLTKTEKTVTAAGGDALRLAGLYSLNRGVHNFWLHSPNEIQSNPKGFINLIHYDDAAEAIVEMLKVPSKGEIYLLSETDETLAENLPLTRKQICDIAVKDKKFSSAAEASPGIDGKIYSTAKFRRNYPEWKPRSGGFKHFIREKVPEKENPLM